MSIPDNLLNVKRRISLACSKMNRAPQEITIVAVSKGRTMEQVREAVAAGITDIGENKVQEALGKYNELYAKRYTLNAVKWHMVGHLQSNKAKEAVKVFDMIQSVDSPALAQEIDKQAARIHKIQDILIEVKTSPEPGKFGVQPQEAVGLVRQALEFKNLNIKGLMTIAPIVDNPEDARLFFRILRTLKESINSELRTPNSELNILSMGMTDDFEVAIEEGATMVRIGRAIFEAL